jgi:hypothetical protein
MFIDSDEIETRKGQKVAESWARDVYRALIRINTTQTGRLVCDAMTYRSFNVYVRPTVNKKGSIDLQAYGNTHASMVDLKGGNSRIEHDYYGLPYYVSGGGSDSVIRFTPYRWMEHDPQRRLLPEDVLLHEMCHSLRHTWGLNKPYPMASFFRNEEELLAVLVTNVFVSECGRPHSIRADHAFEFHELRMGLPDPQDPAYVYRMHRERIDAIAERDLFMTSLYQELALVPAPFNPFREWRKGYITRTLAKPAP